MEKLARILKDRFVIVALVGLISAIFASMQMELSTPIQEGLVTVIALLGGLIGGKILPQAGTK